MARRKVGNLFTIERTKSIIFRHEMNRYRYADVVRIYIECAAKTHFAQTKWKKNPENYCTLLMAK